MIPGQMLQDRYRLVAQLGQGGMGAVYRAWDTRLGVPVALKEMVPQPGLDAETLAQMQAQFRQEAMILARLSHPHLVNVTDFFEEGGRVYLVMRFIEGESLADRIARHGPLPEAQVMAWAGQLLDALAYCHGEGVLHRDIKPQNIIIRDDGQAILVDFGLVKLWNPEDPQTRTVMRGMGTPEYAPPEQYGTRRQHTDPRSDLYSLGATLYHALTGRLPPSASDRMATPEHFAPLREITESVSPAVEASILKAMALPLEQRFATAREMHEALTTSPARISGSEVPQPRRPARAWLVGGAAVFLLIGGGGLWALGRWALGAVAPATDVPEATLEAGLGPAGRTPTASPSATPSAEVTATSAAVPAPTRTASPASTVTTAAPTTAAPTLSAPTSTSTVVAHDPTATPNPTHTVAATPTATPTTMPTTSPTATLAATPSATWEPTVAYEALSLDAVANATQGFAAPPTGDVTLGGIPFSLAARIFQSQAEPSPHNAKPTRARIEAHVTQARRVHLLLTTGNGFSAYAGTKVGEVIAVCDGSPHVVSDLRLGQEVREWHSEPNVVATASRVREVWTGEIAGTSVLGRIDLLSLDLPQACRDGALEALELVDTSGQDAGSLDPAFNLTGITVELLR